MHFYAKDASGVVTAAVSGSGCFTTQWYSQCYMLEPVACNELAASNVAAATATIAAVAARGECITAEDK